MCGYQLGGVTERVRLELEMQPKKRLRRVPCRVSVSTLREIVRNTDIQNEPKLKKKYIPFGPEIAPAGSTTGSTWGQEYK